MTSSNVIVIVGATASGKSAVALELAKKIGGEIINADSRQIYRYLRHGTSQPSETDKKIVPHHLYDFLDPDQTYSAGQYVKDATKVIGNIFDQNLMSFRRMPESSSNKEMTESRRGNGCSKSLWEKTIDSGIRRNDHLGRNICSKKAEIGQKNKTPIIVGGTGLYIKSLFDGISEMPGRDESVRKELSALAQEKGRKFLHDKLKSIDPISAEKIHFQNIQRVVRALEVYSLTGTPISELHKKPSKSPSQFHPVFFGLHWEREKLKERILERTRQIAPLIIEETKEVLKKDFKESDPGLQSLGYRQAVQCLKNQITYTDFFTALLTDTNQYAKRQMTWFKKDPRIKWIKITDLLNPAEVALEIQAELNRKLI